MPAIKSSLLVAATGMACASLLAACSSSSSDTAESSAAGSSPAIESPALPSASEPVLADGDAAMRITLDGCNDCTITLQSSASGALDWASDPIALQEAEGATWVTFPAKYAKGMSVLVTSPAAPGNWAAVLNYDNAEVASKPNPGAFASYKEGFGCVSAELVDNKGTLSLMADVVEGPGLAVYSLQALPASGPAYPVSNGAMKVDGDFLSCKA